MADTPRAAPPAGKIPGKLLAGCAGMMALLFVCGVVWIVYWLSTAHLLTMLSDPSPTKKRWAVDTLIGKGPESAGEAVLATASNEGLDPEVRRVAVYILGEMHYAAAEPKLVALLKDGNEVLGGQAAFALGRMGAAGALPALLGAYDAAPKGIKLRILAALGELGNPGGAPLLMKEAARMDDELVRDTARQAVVKMKEKYPECCG